MSKVRSDNLTLNISQFVRSLQPALAMPVLKKTGVEGP